MSTMGLINKCANDKLCWMTKNDLALPELHTSGAHFKVLLAKLNKLKVLYKY